MPSKDYLIRQIEELGHFLGILLRKLLKMKEENSGEQIDSVAFEALQNEFKIDLNQLITLGHEEFLSAITHQFSTDDQLEKIAAILKVMGEVNSDSFTLSNINYLQKSFALYNYLQVKSTDFSMERQNQLIQINENLRLWGVPPIN